MNGIKSFLKRILRAVGLDRLVLEGYQRFCGAVIRARMRRRGLGVLAHAQEALKNSGVLFFADCGTLLGLMREGQLLRHDSDLDMGVVLDGRVPDTKSVVRKSLLTAGFRLKREFTIEDTVVEEAYYWQGVKMDVFYYRQDGGKQVCHAFYRDSDKQYAGEDLDTVEFVHEPMAGEKSLTIQGYTLRIPGDSERWLREKYGETWRIPDKKWIFWKGPNARYPQGKKCVCIDHGARCWPMK